MKHLIPTAALAERANVDQLANIIRTVDGNHTAGAGAIADGIADSGFLYTFAEHVSDDVQTATAAQIAADLRDAGLTELAENVMAKYTDFAFV